METSRHITLPVCRCVIALLACAVFLPSTVPAEISPEAAAWFRRARSYERVGRTDQAIQLYRRVWESTPDRYDAVQRGTSLLENAGRTGEATAWFDEATTRAPHVALLWVEYGRLLQRTGRREAADSLWARALATVPDTPALAIALADRFLGDNDLAAARKWATIGLDAGGGATFHRRLLDVALAAHDADAAVLHAHGSVAGAAHLVDGVAASIDGADLSRAERDSIASHIMRDARRDDPGSALLGAKFALISEREDLSAELYIAWAGRDSRGASYVFPTAQQVERDGHPEVAARLFQFVAQDQSNSPWAPLAGIQAARIRQEMGDLTAAAAMCRWLLAREEDGQEHFVSANVGDQARFILATVLAEQGAYGLAENHYSAILASATGSLRHQVEFGLTETALGRGRFDEAKSRLRRLARRPGRHAGTTLARLRLAETAMYEGNAATMGTVCGDLLSSAPGADETNDCLALALTLAEARGDTALWREYGRIRYRLQFGPLEESVAGARGLEGTPLAARGALLVADAYTRARNVNAAADTLLAATELFAGSAGGEEALWKLAELLRALRADDVAALQAYERLINEYPDTVYLGPARRWVRKLREHAGAT